MTHHSVFVSDDGNLWVPGLRYHAEPIPSLPGVVAPFEEDMILEVSPDRTILREISLLELFYANELEALLFANGWHTIDAGSRKDLLHLNDIEILSTRDAAAFLLFEAGDIYALVAQPQSRRGDRRRRRRHSFAHSAPHR